MRAHGGAAAASAQADEPAERPRSAGRGGLAFSMLWVPFIPGQPAAPTTAPQGLSTVRTAVPRPCLVFQGCGRDDH